MDTRQCFPALKCEFLPALFKGGISQPALGNTLARDKPHQEGFSNRMIAVKHRVNRGYRHCCGRGQLNNRGLVDQRQAEDIAFETVYRIGGEGASSQNERRVAPGQFPGLVVGTPG